MTSFFKDLEQTFQEYLKGFNVNINTEQQQPMFAQKCRPLNNNFKQQHELHKKEKKLIWLHTDFKSGNVSEQERE